MVISFDSLRTDQAATTTEMQAIKHFLDDPDHLVFVCPHHDIGQAEGTAGQDRIERQLIEYRHHGDHAIPPRRRNRESSPLLGQRGATTSEEMTRGNGASRALFG